MNLRYVDRPFLGPFHERDLPDAQDYIGARWISDLYLTLANRLLRLSGRDDVINGYCDAVAACSHHPTRCLDG